MTIADKFQFPRDCDGELDCYSCIYSESIEGGKETDYCTEKKRFVDFKKPCKNYYSKIMYKKRLGLK